MKKKIKKFNFKNLKDSPKLKGNVIKLIEGSFAYPKEHSFYHDFFPLLKDYSLKNQSYILEKSGQVFGHIGVLKKKLIFKNQIFPTLLLGGICLDKWVRGQGLFKDFFHAVLSLYEKETCLFFLWSDLNELYEKFGFEECGVLYDYPLNNEKHHYVILENKKITPQVINSFQSLRPKSDLYFQRDEQDWKDLREMKGVQVYINNDYKQSGIQSYCLVGKGFDLKEIVHECSHPEIALPGKRLWSHKILSNRWFEKTYYLSLIRKGEHPKKKELLSALKLNTDDSLKNVLGPNENDPYDFFISGIESV